MNDIKYIIKKAKQLLAEYHIRDMFELAKALGIEVYTVEELSLFCDEIVLGIEDPPAFYVVDGERRFCIIDNKFDRRIQEIILAHEIGHDQLHADTCEKVFFIEEAINCNSSRKEYEANLFAAALLIPDDEVLDMIFIRNYDAFQIAKIFDVDVSIISLKVEELMACGYKLSPVPKNSDFIKRKNLRKKREENYGC